MKLNIPKRGEKDGDQPSAYAGIDWTFDDALQIVERVQKEVLAHFGS